MKRALLCALVLVALCVSAAFAVALPDAADATAALREVDAGVLTNTFDMFSQRGLEVAKGLPKVLGALVSELAGSADTTSASATRSTAAATATKTTQNETIMSTTSSRIPNPITTQAPKVAQWTGISVAIVSVAALIAGLVLCKLKTNEQCCFAPKPRDVVIFTPREGGGGGGGRRSKSSSESSLSSHTSGRSFHEATVDPNAPRRSLLHINADPAARNGSDDDTDEEDEIYGDDRSNGDDNVSVRSIEELQKRPSSIPDLHADGAAPFTPTVTPALPPIRHVAPAIAMLPARPLGQPPAASAAPSQTAVAPPSPTSAALSDWRLLVTPDIDREPEGLPLTRKQSASSNSEPGVARSRSGRSASVSFFV